MNEFWLWFWRPIAEFLGAIALIGGVVIVIAIVSACHFFVQRIRSKFKGN